MEANPKRVSVLNMTDMNFVNGYLPDGQRDLMCSNSSMDGKISLDIDIDLHMQWLSTNCSKPLHEGQL